MAMNGKKSLLRCLKLLKESRKRGGEGGLFPAAGLGKSTRRGGIVKQFKGTLLDENKPLPALARLVRGGANSQMFTRGTRGGKQRAGC